MGPRLESSDRSSETIVCHSDREIEENVEGSDRESTSENGWNDTDDSSTQGSDDDGLAFTEPVSGNNDSDAPEKAPTQLRPQSIADLLDKLVDEEEPSRPESARPESMAQLVDTLMRKDNDEDLSDIDSEVKRRVKDFQHAQNERRKKYRLRPFGIIGLFSNLSDIRSDLRWAENAAFRREQEDPYISWKDYEARRNSGRRLPFFTILMLITSLVMMIVAFYLNDWKIEQLSVNPLVGPSPEVLVQLGALQTREMIDNGSWYRLVTAIFLHGGLIHLFMNLCVIALIGRAIERNHGFLNTAVLFFVPAIGGNIISGVMQPGYILVGASGGIFGLIGVCVADIALNWKLMFLVFKDRGGASGCWMRFCCFFWLLFDIVINSLIGFTPFVDNFAHLGGLVYGFLVALTILERLPLSFFGTGSGICHQLRIASYRCVGFIIAATLICVTTVVLGESDGLRSPCYQCRYISCAPFPFWTESKWWYCDGCDAAFGDIYRRTGDVFFSDLELFCPTNGEVVDIDIFDKRYTEIYGIQEALPSFCREYC
jgi:membrane associated rhomboid family serine protease